MLPLNGLLALCTGAGGWPNPLADAGFRVHLIEAPVHSPQGLVVADAILLRDEPATVVLCETKSGANVAPEQAGKYGSAELESVRRPGTVPREVPDDATVAVLYVCSHANEGRIRQGLSEARLDAPVLASSPGRATLDKAPQLAVGPFDLECPGPPPALVPFDEHSPVELVIAPVRAALVAQMARRVDVLDAHTLCADVIPQWAGMTRRHRNALSRKVVEAVSRIARDEFADEIRVESGGVFDARIRIVSSPQDYDPRGRPQGYQRLARAARGGPSAERPGAAPEQLSLDDLAEEGGIDEDEASEV